MSQTESDEFIFWFQIVSNSQRSFYALDTQKDSLYTYVVTLETQLIESNIFNFVTMSYHGFRLQTDAPRPSGHCRRIGRQPIGSSSTCKQKTFQPPEQGGKTILDFFENST